MTTAATKPQGSDSWDAFNMALWEESVGLQRVNAAAYHLTTVLVNGDPEAITQADRSLNAARVEHQAASAKRRGMQVRGFGNMTLQQVCLYAPPHMVAHLSQRLSELRYGSIALGITLNNNKSLIVAGLDRLMKITGKLQETMTERSGVYKRRGFVAPPGASVIVSSKV
ncbi:MAG TPA: hypothetical protein VFA29_00680 [Candidatus Baltobacteraceae bacterium]|nr:hypothetical protein [Candidatus Baltobacteraceae bacterium]